MISTQNPRTPTSTRIGLAVILVTSHSAWHSDYAASAWKMTFFEKQARELDCGYTPKNIKQSIEKARQTNKRHALRIDSNTNNINRVPLVVTYKSALCCLNKIIKDYKPILHAS